MQIDEGKDDNGFTSLLSKRIVKTTAIMCVCVCKSKQRQKGGNNVDKLIPKERENNVDK